MQGERLERFRCRRVEHERLVAALGEAPEMRPGLPEPLDDRRRPARPEARRTRACQADMKAQTRLDEELGGAGAGGQRGGEDAPDVIDVDAKCHPAAMVGAGPSRCQET